MNMSRSIVPILQILANANHDLPTPAIVVAMCIHETYVRSFAKNTFACTEAAIIAEHFLF